VQHKLTFAAVLLAAGIKNIAKAKSNKNTDL
jgi:hypothetical protein